MKVNKILAGLVVAGVCGAGLTAMASSNDGGTNKTVEVKPVNTTTETSIYTGENVTTSEIESYIVNKYGSNWAADLLEKNGDEWDDILENELEKQYGEKSDDIIEDIIDAKEYESGLDLEYTDNDDYYDNDHDDFDDIYDYND